ncbi:MAG: PDZ domain-containing protein [Pyrinomonadaceae bacterium]|nr:PDZ domain-containing protein [Pyrinomonadaceae bacterium]
MILKRVNLLFVSLLLVAGSVCVLAQETPSAPKAPKAPKAPVVVTAPDAPGGFSFVLEGGSFLGVHTEEINRENMSQYGLTREPRGVGITKVVENSPAAKAGLRERDVIVRFDNEPVTSVRKLNRLIGEVSPEHNARLTIVRGGDERDLTVTLGKRSDFNTAFSFPSQRWEDLDKLRDFKLGDNDNNNFSFVFGNNRRIGVTTTQLTKQLADYFGVNSGKGLLITSVRENSPAAKAGLRAGDVITEVDGQTLGTVADLMRVLNRKDDGEMTLTIMRDKSQRTIRLVPERGKDSNSLLPGVYFPPQAMQIKLPKLEKLNLPKVVMPVTPTIVLPQIRVNVPAKVLTLPSTPL